MKLGLYLKLRKVKSILAQKFNIIHNYILIITVLLHDYSSEKLHKNHIIEYYKILIIA